MGGEGSGRKPDVTRRILVAANQPPSMLSESMHIPDYSGVAAHKKTTTANDDRYVLLADLVTYSAGTAITFTTLDTDPPLVSISVTVGTSGAAVPYLNTANTWSAVQTILDGDLALRNPANTFSTTLKSGAVTGNRTITLPTSTSTLAGLGNSNSWTGQQTFGAAGIKIIGTSNGSNIATIKFDDGGAATNPIFNLLSDSGTNTVPTLDAANSWSVAQSFDGGFSIGLSQTLSIGDGSNFQLGTTTGTKFGTGTNQLIGFYNKTPIVQQANTAGAVTASALYTGTEQKMLTDCYTVLRNLGLLS